MIGVIAIGIPLSADGVTLHKPLLVVVHHAFGGVRGSWH
jgi:hypothetical protein